MNKNIVFFQNSILPADGGVPRVSDVISKELINRGYKCYYIFYDKDNRFYDLKIKLKIDLNQSYKKNELLVLEFIKKNEINIFVCQNAYSSTFIKVYKQIRLLYPLSPFLCFLHASPDYWKVTYQFKNTFLQYKFFIKIIKNLLKTIIYPFYNPYVISTNSLYKLSDKFVLLSDRFKPMYTELYFIDNFKNKLITIPNPLTFDSYFPTNQIMNKEKIVLIVSRLVEDQKKISLALRIWQQVLQNSVDDWSLYIVGSGPDEKYYKNYTIENKINNVFFVGQKNNVIEYYRRASIFIMTSIWEGLPMSLLEAQQNGVVPIVFDNFLAVYDIVMDGINGYIIHNNNMEKFTEKLLSLIYDNEIRSVMALNSIESSKRFHVSNVVDQWERNFI